MQFFNKNYKNRIKINNNKLIDILVFLNDLVLFL